MALIPASMIGRTIAVVWLLSCAGVLTLAWVQRSVDDMPIAVLLLMIYLTAPIGLVVSALDGVANAGIRAPFWQIVPLWIVFTVAGYAQWFVLVPHMWRLIRGQRAI